MLLIRLQIQNKNRYDFNYLLFTRSDNNTSACCTDHFCDKINLAFVILHLLSFAVQTQIRQEWVTIVACKKLYGKKRKGKKERRKYSIYNFL